MPSKKTGSQKTAAITGATGFLGKHVLDAAKEKGLKVKALTRKPRLSDDHVEWIEGTLEDGPALEKTFKDTDLVIHMAGLTKALNRNEFFDVNLGGTKKVLNAAKTVGAEKLYLISSLAAREPLVSHYGASKAAAEGALLSGKWPFKWTIIRPPAIYGPHDLEILKILKASKFGFLPAPGSVKNRFSMIHAADLAKAIFAMPDSGYNSDIIEIDDGKPDGYQISDVASAIASFDGKIPKLIPVPYSILALSGLVGDAVAAVSRKPSMLTLSSVAHLSHPDWVIRSSRRPKIDDWRPEHNLASGMKNTIDWYRKNGYL